MSTSTAPTPAPNIFKNRFVRTIMTSGLLLQIGIWVRNYAILMYVMDMTNNDPTAISMISVAEFAPIFLFSLIGGTFADRWRPKRTMIICDLLSALSVFAVLFTLMYGSWQAVFFVTLVSSILSQFSLPSGMRLFKTHVPDAQMGSVLAAYQTLQSIFTVGGPALGTFVFQQFGIEVSVAVMGVMFVLSAVVLLLLPPDTEEMKQKNTTTVWQEMKDGFNYVKDRVSLRTLGGTYFLAGTAIGLIQPLAVFLLTENLGMPKENLQYLMMANGVAMLLGGGVIMGIAQKVPPAKVLFGGLVISAVLMVATVLSTEFWLTLVLQFLSGLFLPAINIGITTMIMMNTEANFVGRVNGVLNPLFLGTMVVLMSSSGFMKENFSLLTLYLTSSVILLIGCTLLIPLFKQKSLQQVQAEAAVAADQEGK